MCQRAQRPPRLNWYLQSSPLSKTQTLPGPATSWSCYKFSNVFVFLQRGLTYHWLPICSTTLKTRAGSSLDDSGILLSLPAPQPSPNTCTPPPLSASHLAVIDRLLNYEKVERALVKHRGIFITVCVSLSPHHIYQSKNAFTQGKKIYRVLEGTVFILLSAFCPQTSSLFNGLLAPSCLLIGRISYRNGIGIESKPEGSADRQPTQAICLHATTVP